MTKKEIKLLSTEELVMQFAISLMSGGAEPSKKSKKETDDFMIELAKRNICSKPIMEELGSKLSLWSDNYEEWLKM